MGVNVGENIDWGGLLLVAEDPHGWVDNPSLPTLLRKAHAALSAKPSPIERGEVAKVFDDAIGECQGYAYDGGAGSICWDQACATLKERVLAILALRSRPVEWRPTHRHVKRGTDYQVIGSASLQAGQQVGEAATLVIYRDAKGRLWARPEVEFDDGRFEPVPAAEG